MYTQLHVLGITIYTSSISVCVRLNASQMFKGNNAKMLKTYFVCFNSKKCQWPFVSCRRDIVPFYLVVPHCKSHLRPNETIEHSIFSLVYKSSPKTLKEPPRRNIGIATSFRNGQDSVSMKNLAVIIAFCICLYVYCFAHPILHNSRGYTHKATL